MLRFTKAVLALAIVTILGMGSMNVHAQQWTWEERMASLGSLTGNGIAVDGWGNVYVTGTYENSADFGNGVTLPAFGQKDIFLAKYAPGGSIIWAIGAGSAAPDGGEEVTVDVSGDVYFTGYFGGTITLATATGTTTVTSSGLSDLFVAKVNPANGATIWLSQAGGTANDAGKSVTVTSTGVFVAGFFEINANFGLLPVTSYGSRDAVVAMCNVATGAWVWALNGGTTNDDEAASICDDGTNVYVAGFYGNPGFAFGTTTLPQIGGIDGFVTKLGPAGLATWSAYIGSPTRPERPTAITCDGTDVYVTGNSIGGATISFSGTVIKTTTCPGLLSDFWVSKFFGASGSVDWCASEGGQGADNSQGVVVGGPSFITICANFETAITIAGFPLSGVGTEIAVVSYNTSFGTPFSPESAGGPGASNSYDIANDPACGLLVTGDFTLNHTFGTLPTMNSSGTINGLNGRLSPNVIPVPYLNADTLHLCYGDSAVISLLGPLGTIYWESSTDFGATWSVIPGATLSSLTVAPTMTTLYQCHYAGRCATVSDTCWVQMYAPNPPSINGLPDTLCVTNAAVPFTLTPNAPLGGPVTYTSPDFINMGAGNFLFNPALGGGGFHRIEYSTVNPFGCTLTTADSVWVSAPIPLSISGMSGIYCSSDTLTYTLTGSVAPSGSFSASCPCFVDQGNGTALFTPSAAPIGSYISLSYAYYNGCQNSWIDSTIVENQFSVQINGLPANACQNDPPITLTTNTTSGNFLPVVPGFVDSLNGTATFDPSIAALGSYTIIYYDTAGICTDTDTALITLNPNPIVAFAGNMPAYCSSDAIDTLFGNQTQGYTYLPSQPFLVDLGGGIATFNPGIAPASTPIPVSYSYTDSMGCSALFADTVIVHPNPVPVVSGLQPTYCLHDPLDTLIGNYPNFGSFTPSNAVVTIGNGLATFDPDLATLNANNAVIYSITDSNGCAATATISTYVSDLPQANAGIDQSICAGNAAVIGSATIPGLSYAWYAGGPIVVDTVAQPSVTPMIQTTYLLQVTNPYGCQSEDTVVVSVIATPIADAGGDKLICKGDSVSLGGNLAGIPNLIWSDSLGFQSQVTFPTVSPAQSQTYLLVVSDVSAQCRDSDTVAVSVVLPVSTPNAGPDQTVFAGATVTLAGSTPTTGTGTWIATSGSLSFSDVHAPNASIPNATPGDFTLIWMLANAPCPSLSDTMRLSVLPLVLPTGFSPNADNSNDLLIFKGLEAYPENSLQVFNRWGGKVYERKPYLNDWNGVSNSGQPLVEDTYYYILELAPGNAYNNFLELRR